MKNFQNLITQRRKTLKLTQKDLAEKLNVSDKTISKWETGRSYPEVTLLSTLAKALEMDVTELLEVDELKEKKIDLEEVESYDNEVIEKYKNKIKARTKLRNPSSFKDSQNIKINVLLCQESIKQRR